MGQGISWHILGAGAIGTLTAAIFREGGMDTCLLRREEPPAGGKSPTRIQIEIEIEGLDGESRHYQLGTSACAAPEPIDHLLVTTKAPDVRAAVASVAHRLHNLSVVVLLTNGMGVKEQITPLVPTRQVFSGITTHGAIKLAPLVIRHTGAGRTRVGSLDGYPEPDCLQPWRTTALNYRWHGDIKQALWRKLAVNCVINPLSAIHQCCNGEVISSPHLADQARALCAEIAPVMWRFGIDISADSLYEEIARVASETAANRSSMLQDVEARRPTEIEYLNGYVVTQASKFGLPSPINTTLLEQIKSLI